MIFRYFLVGAASALVDWTVFAVLALGAGLPWFPAAMFSFVAATSVNYVLSVRHVFRSGVRFARTQEIGLVFLVSALGLVVNQSAMWLLIEGARLGLMPSKILATGAVFLWNYGMRSYFIFRERA